MNRRDLLKRIGVGLPSIAMVPVLAAVEMPKTVPSTADDFMFNGWRVVWRGWRDIPNMDVQVGFWIGYGDKQDSMHLYSAWPGETGFCHRGGTLNIACRQDQVMPTIGADDAELKWYRNECLERLKRMIVKIGPPPFPLEKYRAGELNI